MSEYVGGNNINFLAPGFGNKFLDITCNRNSVNARIAQVEIPTPPNMQNNLFVEFEKSIDIVCTLGATPTGVVNVKRLSAAIAKPSFVKTVMIRLMHS